MYTLNSSVLDQVLMSADMLSKVVQAMPTHGTAYEMLRAHQGWQSALAISATRRDFHTGLVHASPIWRFQNHATNNPKD